jgi:arginine deiminase
LIDRIRVNSEIGRLHAVLVHEPGRELENLIPRYEGGIQFDEVPWLKGAKREHEEFVKALGTLGAEVYFIEKLTAELIKESRLKEMLVEEYLKGSGIYNGYVIKAVHDYLLGLDDNEVVETIAAGIPKSTFKYLISDKELSMLTKEFKPFYAVPLPGMYYTRDHGAVIKDVIFLCNMTNTTRQRETILLRFLCEHHPIFNNPSVALWTGYDIPPGIEGGDLMVLNDESVVIGLSERTTEAAIEALAYRLLVKDRIIKCIIVIQIPRMRVYMHLDTVFTMLDYDKFLLFPGIKNDIRVYKMIAVGDRVESIEEQDLAKALSDCMGLSKVHILDSGGSNPIASAREQWGDSTNIFVLSPGVAVSYDRNEETNRMLEKTGIKVIEFSSSELVRGRGGPRCMTMPLLRDDI